MQTIYPVIAYADAVSAMDWLVKAFGFRERRRMLAPDGRVSHREPELSGNIVMGATPSADYEGSAREAGATILGALEGGGAGRQYRSADIECHRWMFAQKKS